MAEQKLSYITKMPDGTIKQMNPFSGEEILTVPGRSKRPINKGKYEILNLDKDKGKEDYCAFCETKYLETPPEKSRLVLTKNGKFKQLDNLKAEELNNSVAEFRRIPNLFEIISYEYWNRNYGYTIPKKLLKIKNEYISTEMGLSHVLNIVDGKMRMSGFSEKEIAKTSVDKKLELANGFFAGGHELIVGKHHFTKNAKTTLNKWSSGEMTEVEHFNFLDFTIKALKDIYDNNRFVKYVTVFQNWLTPAGASFDHIHKQLVAIDNIGLKNKRRRETLRKNPNIFNNILDYAIAENLVIAENDTAIAIVAFGYLEPTLAVFSKSKHPLPWNLSSKELQDFSDLVRACHAAMGSDIPCNEEWYYKPPASKFCMPFYVLIKWRISTPAGFEAVTNIFINTIDPWNLRNRIVAKLYILRFDLKIRNIKISKECDCKKNCLEYIR